MPWVPKWVNITIENQTRNLRWTATPNRQVFLVQCNNESTRYTMEWIKDELFILNSHTKRLKADDAYKSILLDFMDILTHRMTVNEVSLLPQIPRNNRINVRSGDTIYCPDGQIRTVARNLSPPLKFDKFGAHFVFTDGHQFTGDFNWFITTPLKMIGYQEYPIMCKGCNRFELCKNRDLWVGPMYITKMKGFYCGICVDQLQESHHAVSQYDRR